MQGTGPAETAARWLSAEEQEVWRLLLRVDTALRDRLDADLRARHRISLGDYGVLVHLGEASEDGLRMSELAERVLLSRSGLTRRIDALARRGLVARRACPEDGRGAVAELTEEGRRRLVEAAPTHVEGVRRYLIDTLEDLVALSKGLRRIEEALEGLP